MTQGRAAALVQQALDHVSPLPEWIETGLLDRMEKAGWVRRADDPAAVYLRENGPGIQSARQRLASFDARALIDCWKSLTAADYRDVLPTITVPALLVYGGASNFYSTATAHYVRDHIPDARLHTYPDVDHAPHLWEKERFVRDVLDFVAG